MPICFAIEGDTLYTAWTRSRSGPAGSSGCNIEANPQVEVLIDHYEDDWSRLWWVRLRGTARIVDDRTRRGAARRQVPAVPRAPPSGPVIAVDDRGADRVDELAFLSATEQADLVRRGEVASAELVELYLERIERLDPRAERLRHGLRRRGARGRAAGELPTARSAACRCRSRI